MSAKIPETVLVVGSGICGLQIAVMARKAGFRRVIVLERSHLPYSGTSLLAPTLQTGGQYPFSPATAADCLFSAMMFRQAMPDFVHAPASPKLFVVTAESERDPRCASFAAVVDNYQALRPAYSRALANYCRTTGAAWADASQAFFGDPSRLGVVVDAQELIGTALGPHVGGVVGGERGLNQPVLGSFLLECAREHRVEVIVGACVTRIEPHARGYRAHVAGGGWWDGQHLVSAAWLGSWGFARPEIEAHGELRCVVVLDIRGLSFPGRTRAVMAMQGPSGAAYEPLDDRIALLTSARPGASQVRLLTALGPADAAERTRSLNGDFEEHAHVRAIVQSAADGPFPFLQGAKPSAAFITPVVRSTLPEERRYWGPVRSKDGYIVSIPTKATYSTRTALDTLRMLLRDAVSRRSVTPRHVRGVLPPLASPLVVPEPLRLQDMPTPSPATVQRFARERGLAA
jgi:2-polyprenyl-6-methoxyphenol hydroxylase-like FAD-dependent oxidoreductase